MDFQTSASLEGLQTDEQRRVLDTVAQVRKCGLDSILSLPQIVVCGQQSSGKSSTLEALTEIPFPRNDNLCTRYATEIILRRGPTNSLTVKVIPDPMRPAGEQAAIKGFQESITDFAELPRVMDMAMDVMGIQKDGMAPGGRAFARDVLSIEIEGPSRPQLTLVDIPGLIETATKGVSPADIDLVTEITDFYIKQPRTICLAVVSATSDYATQRILTKVREVDPEGDRTLGVITKPDRLPAGSGSERSFIDLARNADIFFKLGWHVLKNRAFEEDGFSLTERNDSEARWFRKSNFQELGPDCLGVAALRSRLSTLLFEHVKRELPQLQKDLQKALKDAEKQLEAMGDSRSNPTECRTYLANLSLNFYELCKAGMGGSYEGSFFEFDGTESFSPRSPQATRRIRAMVQLLNNTFNHEMLFRGHKFHVLSTKDSNGVKLRGTSPKSEEEHAEDEKPEEPILLSRSEGLAWVRDVLVRTRGREVLGTFNPLLIGELFWEQSSKWHLIAKEHVDEVARACRQFLEALLFESCSKDVKTRLWSSQMETAFNERCKAASEELDSLIRDIKDYPINYNHYFTDTVNKLHAATLEASLEESIDKATTHKHLDGCQSTHTSASVNVKEAVRSFLPKVDPSMENVSCGAALDHALALYKVRQNSGSLLMLISS